MAKHRMKDADWKPHPKRHLIGHCPFCYGVLCRMDIVPGKKSRRLATRRVECRYCNRTFKWSRLKAARPLGENGHRVRTRWSRPTMQNMIETFIHFFNLHPLVTQEQIEGYKKRMVASGWDYIFVVKAEQTAARRTQWRDNEFLENRFLSQEQQPAYSMLPKWMRR